MLKLFWINLGIISYGDMEIGKQNVFLNWIVGRNFLHYTLQKFRMLDKGASLINLFVD